MTGHTKENRKRSSKEEVEELNRHRKSVNLTLTELTKLGQILKESSNSSDPKKKRTSLESFSRHKHNLEKAIEGLSDIVLEESIVEEAIYSAQIKVSVVRHKNNVLKIVDDLKVLEDAIKKELDPDPKNKGGIDTALDRHKRNVQNAINELAALDAKLEKQLKMAQQNEEKSQPRPQPQTEKKPPVEKEEVQKRKGSISAKDQEGLEEALVKKHYAEDDIEIEFQLEEKKKADHEKMYILVENDINVILMWVAGLTVVAALLTALTCYMFAELPDDIYSSHIFREIFMLEDEVITITGFSKGMGLHSFCPLPMVLALMYAMLLYIVYMVQYPKTGKCAHFIRCTIYAIIELYLILCAISYIIDVCNVTDRLDLLFEHDKKGLKGNPVSEIADHSQKLHKLDHVQYYFGCCGYRNKNEWGQVYPELYNMNGTPTWPLSCCDAQGSGVACYHPVKESVTYTDYGNDIEHQQKKELTTERLHTSTCFETEDTLIILLVSLVTFHLLVFITITIYIFVVYWKTAYLVKEHNIDIKPKVQYIDSL